MGTETTKTKRKTRSDSVRNKQRLLEAAAVVFSAGNPQASLESVARHAGVGIGTLYRHFPTREDLFDAVYRHEVDHLGELAEELLTEEDPVEAIRKWLQANIRLVATKKGMIEALQLAAHGSSDLKKYSFERLSHAIGLLLNRAASEGQIRSDITPADILRALAGIFYSYGSEGWKSAAVRLADVFVDGLRIRPDR